ncbi:MAG: trypsin-like peptidase domain-containing protein [Alphaproteobacteria bacterium]|nr:trypsin-like peptidase domain-containing protein [Alphaproteobacteria bacterium]
MRANWLAIGIFLILSSAAGAAYEVPEPDVSGLTPLELRMLEENCKSTKEWKNQYNVCRRDGIKALKTPGKPDLSAFPEEIRERMEMACARKLLFGGDLYHKCLKRDMEELAKESYRPNLDALTPEERATVEKACENAANFGVGSHNGCLRHNVAKVKNMSYGTLELQGLDDKQKAKVREICDIVLFENNPAKYSACLNEEAVKLGGKPMPGKVKGVEKKLPPATSQHTERKSGTMDSTLSTIKREKKEIPWGATGRASMPAHLSSSDLPPDQVFAKVAPSVYVVLAGKSVEHFKQKKEISQGSAIAISTDQLITNCHVVAGKPFVLLVQERNVLPARILGGDAKSDRCLLSTVQNSVTPIGGIRSFGDLKVGERVYTIGTPAGLERTLGEGLVSGLRTVEPHGKLVQTTAPISPGSSGGGLFDSKGNLVGVTTFLLKNMQQLNFAIAAEEYWK